MTETNFTPGPWEARYSSVIDVEKDEIIAVMTCGSVYRKNELEDYDTARLIAAAPELYSLLEIAACPCCDGSGAYYDGYGEVCQCQWCDERTKVIAKARGEA